MNNQSFIDDCFKTLYRLVKSAPEKIDKPVVDVFKQFISNDPVKSFIIISNYYDQYCDDNQEIQYPYDMISLLFSHFSYFIVSDISTNFIKLILYIYLNEDKKITLTFTSDEFIDDVIDSLSSKNINDFTLSLIYRLLTILHINKYIKIEKTEISDATIASHLRKEAVKKSILDFLLLTGIKLGPTTVRRLSNLNHCRPFYILLQFARSKYDHSSLVDSPDWLTVNESKMILRMRIFLALLIDTKCRKNLARLPKTIEYLTDLVNRKFDGILKLASTCVRRLIFPESLDNFQKFNFFLKYWNAIKDLGQPTLSSCIMSIDKLVDTGYTEDLNEILNDISTIINTDGPASIQAVRIISKASKYPQCKQVLKKYVKYFAKLKDTGDFQKECQFFEKNIK